VNRATRQKLSTLHSLARHPKTPEHERESAEARIAEIKARVCVEEDKARARGRRAMPVAMADMVDRISRQGLVTFKRRVRSRVATVEETVHDQWPFGWVGPREKLKEFESGYGFRGEYVIGWKCPDCGDHVTRVVDAGMMFRFKMNPDAMDEYVNHIVSGETNHLCVACWRKWNER